MAKSGVFTVWLVGRASPSKFNYACYGDGPMYSIGMTLKSYFDRVCEHSSCQLATSDYSWEMGKPAPQDVVVYCSYSKAYGVIAKKGGMPVHDSASGGTFKHSNGMISEIYMEAFDGAANFPTLAANLIFHEIMHNKLDASGNGGVKDIHTGNGLANAVVSAGTGLTKENIALMAGVLHIPVPQFESEMQKPLLN